MPKKNKNNLNKNLLIIGGAVVLFVLAMFLINMGGVGNVRTQSYNPTPTPTPTPPEIDYCLGVSAEVSNNNTSCSCYVHGGFFEGLRLHDTASAGPGKQCFNVPYITDDDDITLRQCLCVQ